MNSQEMTLDQFLLSQIKRIEKGLAEPTPTARYVAATRVRHAVGVRKPSLSQQELEGREWIPSQIRSTP